MESYSTPPGTQRKRAATEVGMGVVSSRSRVQASLATLVDDRRGCRIMGAGPKSPITWLGGKGRLASRIIKEFPAHHTYCEAFGGSASVLLHKSPSKVEILNDKDGRLWNLMKVIQDPELYPRLRSACESTLFSRAEFNLSMGTSNDPVENARRFMVRQRQSRGGLGKQWSFCVEDSKMSMASVVRRWRAGVERLPALHRRLRRVQIEMDDFRQVLRRYDSSNTLFFLDPPYLPELRVGGRYALEMTKRDHREMVALLIGLKGFVVLSGYDHRN
jgi:DNA adenine methylase